MMTEKIEGVGTVTKTWQHRGQGNISDTRIWGCGCKQVFSHPHYSKDHRGVANPCPIKECEGQIGDNMSAREIEWNPCNEHKNL